jgi:hypothetical protein
VGHPQRRGCAAGIAVQYADLGLTSAGALTLTAALDPALAYVGDTSGVTPTIGSPTLTWRLPRLEPGVDAGFTVWVRVPDVPLGTTYPLTLALAAAGEAHPADNSVRLEVVIARQVYLPAAMR